MTKFECLSIEMEALKTQVQICKNMYDSDNMRKGDYEDALLKLSKMVAELGNYAEKIRKEANND